MDIRIRHHLGKHAGNSDFLGYQKYHAQCTSKYQSLEPELFVYDASHKCHHHHYKQQRT